MTSVFFSCVKLFWLISFQMSSFWQTFFSFVFAFALLRLVFFLFYALILFSFFRVLAFLKQKSFACRDLWMRENKCRNLAVLKSCCNEALKENSLSSLALLLLILSLTPNVEDNILPGRRKIHLKVSNLFYGLTHMHTQRKTEKNNNNKKTHRRKIEPSKKKRRGRKLHRKYFAWLFYLKLFVDVLTGFIIPEVSHFGWNFSTFSAYMWES